VLAEEFVTGQELTAPFLGERALPLVRIVAPGGNYDYQNKYFTDDTQYFCPSGLPEAQERSRPPSCAAPRCWAAAAGAAPT
jgi:D-alanine-D-alanine ligase